LRYSLDISMGESILQCYLHARMAELCLLDVLAGWTPDRAVQDRAEVRVIVFCSGLGTALYSHIASSPPVNCKAARGYMQWHYIQGD